MGGLRTQRVLVDANVLYSRTVRDWLGLLYTVPESEPFLVCWTEDILAETLYHLRKKHPTWDGGRIAHVRDAIAGTFEAGRITDFTVEPGTVVHDAHVAAAAKACGAEILLTFNEKDFADANHEMHYEVMTPDTFFGLVDDADPSLVAACARKQIEYWSKRGEVRLVESLQDAGCPAFAERVLHHLQRQALQG